MGFQVLDEDDFDEAQEGIDLGPDERDLDLMDGSWEEKYYSGRMKTRNWNAIGAGIAVLVVASLVVPMILGLFS